jgi:hypothetical protein
MKKIILLISFLSLSAFIANAQHTSKENPTSGPTFGPVVKPPSNINNSNLPPNEECYCHFYNDFNNYIDFINWNIIALSLQSQNQWYTEQRSVLDEELIDRLGLDPDFSHNYSSDFLQQNFFKEAFGPSVSNRFLTDAKNADRGARDGHLESYRETYIPRKLFQYAQNNSQYDFGGLTHNNKTIESMSFIEAQNLFNHYATINVNHEVDWRYHSARIQKINNMLAHQPILNPSAEYLNFNNFISAQFNNHVNAQPLSNIVSVMTGYMIYQSQLNFLYSFPQQNHVFLNFGYNFYSPYNNRVQIQNYMNTIINNAGGGGTHDIGEPNMTPEEIMREYSMTGMNLGNRAASFYEDKPTLREEAAKFQEQNQYDSNSKNMVKRLAEYFLDDEPFMPESYWEGTQSWGQDSDRPERLMNVRLSSQALNWGLNNFGGVLEALEGYSNLYQRKGELIRKHIVANAPSSVVSSLSMFTNEELGKLFDFDNRGSNNIGIQFSAYARDRIQELEHYDNLYNWSIFTDSVKKRMLKFLANGDTVNFEQQITLAANLSDCVRNIISRMINNRDYVDLQGLPDWIRLELNLSGTILDIFSNSGAYHLKYSVSNIHLNSGDNAGTTYDPVSRAFLIELDSNYVKNATDLSIARTIIHESLHAYISLIYGTQVNSDIRLSIDTLMSSTGVSLGTAEHNFMSTQFIRAMGRSLEAWDNGTHIPDYYFFLSWSGEMLLSPAFNALPDPLQDLIWIATVAEEESNSSALGINNCN